MTQITQSPDDLSSNSSRSTSFVRGSLLVLVPLGILLAPFFFQRSVCPQIGRYSFGFFCALMSLVAGALALSLVVGHLCGRQGKLTPAYFALMLILSCVAAVVLVELSLRFRHNDAFAEYRKWGHCKSPIYGYEAKPNHSWQVAGASYSTDRFGFRTHVSAPKWHEEPRADGQPLLFALGGSSTFGFALNDDQTWPHLLEARLRKSSADTNITVINAGNNGHNSLQTLLRFYLRVLDRQPTHVLYYESINDAFARQDDPESIFIEDEALFSVTKADYVALRRSNKCFYFRTLLAYFLGTYTGRLQDWLGARGAAPESGEPDIELQNPGNETPRRLRAATGKYYLRNVQTLTDLCRRHQVQLVLLTFIYDRERISRFARSCIDHYNGLLRDLAKAEGLLLVDLAADFGGTSDRESYFCDDHYHPSLKGARYIAERVAESLDPSLARAIRPHPR